MIRYSITALTILIAMCLQAEAATLETWHDGTAYVSGTVDETTNCYGDNFCSLMLNIDSHKVELVYYEDGLACANSQPAMWFHVRGHDIKGKAIKAYGSFVRQGHTYILRFCSSKDFFILGENDPLPLNFNKPGLK